MNRRETDGFTMIEVLVAMVILALGLLGLEALGIGAARSIALADRQSGYATIASDSLESALHQLRRGEIPSQFCDSGLRFGDRMSREVDLSDPQLARVAIRIIPAEDAPHTAEPYDLESSVYLPAALVGSAPGAACE